MENRKKSYLFVSIAVLLWASTAAIAKLLLQNLSGIQIMFYSFIFAILGLFSIVIAQGKLKSLKSYTKKDYFHIAYMGTLGCFLYSIFLLGALKYAPAQEAFILNYLWPIMVVIFATLILKEKLGVKKILGLIFSFFGIYIVMTKGNLLSLTFTNIKGDILAVLGAVAYGLFSVLGKKHKFEISTSTLLYYCFAFILVLISILTFSSIPQVSLLQLAGLAWIGLMTNAVAFIFWFKALEYGETAQMTNMVFLTPFISLIYIYFLVGEQILPSSIVGLIFIVLGIVIQTF